MIKNIKTSLVLFGLLFCVAAQAADVVQIHTNQEVYSNGDQLHFSVQFSTQDQWNSVSIINCSLSNASGSYASTQSLKVKSGMTSGTFKLPIDLAADWYYLTVEVKEYLKGKSLLVSEKRIAIYNDYSLPSQLTDWTAEVSTAGESAPSMGPIKVPSGGTYAVAIKSNLLATVESQVTQYSGSPVSTNVLGSPDSSQEEFLLTGQIIDPESKQPRQASGLVLVDQADCTLEYFDTDSEGNFAVTMKAFDSERTYQVASLFGETVYIKKAALAKGSSRISKPLLYTTEIVQYLKQSKQRKLIGQIYKKANMDAPVLEEIRKPIIDRKLQVDSYVLFEDVYTFLKEVSSPIKVKKEKGQPTLRILNSDRKVLFPGEPRIVIDGKLIANSKVLFDLPVADIDRFEIVQLGTTIRRNYGSLGNNGLLFVYTKEGDFSATTSDSFSFTGLTKVVDIEMIDQNALNQKISLSPSLHWEASKSSSDGSMLLNWSKPKFDKQVKVSVMGRNSAGTLVQQDMMMTIQ